MDRCDGSAERWHDECGFFAYQYRNHRPFFAPGEVSEIWLTFSDPQMKKATKRLTSTYFMERYRKFLKPDGLIHLKTDSNFMFTYTRYMVEENKLPVEFMTEDLYHSGLVDDILGIRTYYEQQWLDRGLNIKYMKFRLPHEKELHEPMWK